jgi:hypothetical protein
MLITAGSLTLVGCGPDAANSASASSESITTTTTSEVACARPGPSSTDTREMTKLTARLVRLPMPAGTCFFAVETTELASGTGIIAVRVSLTMPGSVSAEDLRPAATDIAHVVKDMDFSPRVHELLIDNWGFGHPPYGSYLTDADFDAHPWDGTPSHEAELAAWTKVPYELPGGR